MIGFLVGSYNDLDLSKKMYPSLIASLTDMTCTYGYALTCVDAGSTDGSIDWWGGKCTVIEKGNEDICKSLGVKGSDLFHLSVALNAGIEFLIQGGATYICHIHPDMLFPEKGWEMKLVDFINDNPLAGKVGADDISIRGGHRAPANQCPWMMSKEVIDAHKETYGYVFDERYVGIGGMEDHNLCRQQLLMGYVPVICGTALVDHFGGEGMGTRRRRETNPEAFYNRNLYARDYPGVCLHDWAQQIDDFWSEIEWK